MRGVFWQDPCQRHVPLRRKLLAGRDDFPDVVPKVPVLADDVEQVVGAVGEQMSAHGAAMIQLDRPMTDHEFLTLGSYLGRPQREHSPSVQARVTAGVILNLVTDHAATDNVDLQPFASNWLSLHSESSAAPLSDQPRFIVLMCLESGQRTAQTVLVPMAVVANLLSAEDHGVLSATRYADRGGAPMLVRHVDGGRASFSIRDMQQDPLYWEHLGTADAPGEVNGSLGRLYSAMYGATTFGVTWVRGLLVVIDNTAYFHGRAAAPPPGAGPVRHLKRMRISGWPAEETETGNT